MSKVFDKPTIKKLINKKIGLRLFFSSLLLFVYVFWQSTNQITDYFNRLQFDINQKISSLKDFIISQELIPNQNAVDLALNNFNNSYNGLSASLIKKTIYTKHKEYRIPFTFVYYFPINEVDKAVLGTLVIKVNLFSNKELLAKTVLNIFLLILAWVSVLIVMLPLYKKIPNEIIINPIHKLLGVLKSNNIKYSGEIDMPTTELEKLSNYLLDYLKKKEAEHRIIAEYNLSKALNRKTKETIHDLKVPLFTLEKILRVENLNNRQFSRIEKAKDSLKGLLNSLSSTSGNFFTNNSHLMSTIDNVLEDSKYYNEKINFFLKENILLRSVFVNINSLVLYRVITNLIDNSINASAKNIVISLEKNENRLIISIEDNGIGMDEVTLKSISHDDHVSSKSTKGHGIGVSFVRKSLKEVGGRVVYSSKKNTGTLAQIYINLSSPVDFLLFDYHADQNKMYVILDDDKSWLAKIRKIFIARGLSVKVFSDIESFKKFYLNNKEKPLRMMIDYQLGEITGLELIKRLNIAPDTVIIATENHNNSELINAVNGLDIKILPKSLIKYLRII